MARLNSLRLAVASFLVITLMGVAMAASQRSAAAMAGAANSFLAGLSPDQRARAVLPSKAKSGCAGISSPTRRSRARG